MLVAPGHGPVQPPMIILVAFVLHVFIAYRMGRLGRTRWFRWGLPAALSVLFVLTALVPLTWRMKLDFIPEEAWPLLRNTSFFAMGLYSLIFTLWGIREIGWLVARRRLPADPERRRFIGHALNLGVLGGAVTAGAIGYREARSRAKVVTVDVPIRGLAPALEGFTIVQLSDVHVGHTIRRDYVRAIVDAVNERKADLVAITGDLVDGSVEDLDPDVAPLGDIESRLGTFFCTGNHEYYAGALEWIAKLDRLGIRTLVNEHVVVERGGAPLVLGGVCDYSMGRYVSSHESSPKRAIEGAPKDAPKVLLAHQPRSAFAAAEAGFDLQLSGHTHGGQFFPWNLVVHAVHPFVAGLERVEEKMWIYVSKGTGYFGPPVRIGADAEITELRLVRA